MSEMLEVRSVAPEPTNRDYLIAVAAVVATTLVVRQVVRLVKRRSPLRLGGGPSRVLSWGIGGIAGLMVLYAASEV